MSASIDELDGGTEVPREREIEVDAEDLSPEVRKLVAKAAWAAARDALNRAPIPHNYGRIANGEKRILYWIIGIFGSLFVALGVMSVEGMWGVSKAVGGLTQQVTDYHQQDAQNSERNHQDIQRIDDLLEKRDGS